MRISFAWPAPGGGDWSPEAAASLVGQETKVDGKPAKIIDCHLTSNGPLEVMIEVDDSLRETIVGTGEQHYSIGEQL